MFTHHKEQRGGAITELVSSGRVKEKRVSSVVNSSAVPVITINAFSGKRQAGVLHRNTRSKTLM